HRTVGHVSDGVSLLVAETLGHIHLAELPGTKKGDRVLHSLMTSALGPRLHDPAILPSGLDHAAAFAHIVTHGLLDVDILPRLTAPDRRQRVPVVGRRDRDGVNLLVVENP